MISDCSLIHDAMVPNKSEAFIDSTNRIVYLYTEVSHPRVLYSFLKEQWYFDPLNKNLIGCATFPIRGEHNKFENNTFFMVDGWKFVGEEFINNGQILNGDYKSLEYIYFPSIPIDRKIKIFVCKVGNKVICQIGKLLSLI